MASVSSLDQDMKKLRLGRYTPQAANEARSWIESTLGEKLPAGDLLDALKDGTALCKLANLAVPAPGIKFKKSQMPFMQMENISQFLRVCELPPLNLHAHDRFLTVDLYESKDPAQVLQCIGAFSRVANSINSRNFPDVIGPKKNAPASIPEDGQSNGGFDRSRNGAVSSMSHTTFKGSNTFNPISQRALSPHYSGKSSSSNNTEGGPISPQGGVSSWSKRSDHGTTAPAWNIAQYGYMGGASQGNQGISFGARRQITTPGPKVPTLAEKERLRKEQEALAEQAESRRRKEIEDEEERERLEEERRWEEETRRRKEEEKRQVEQQKREWEEQERRWDASEEERLREEQAQKLESEPQRKRAPSDARLRGQYLSQYQAEQAAKPRSRRNSNEDPEIERTAEQARMRELERQLEEAKERERQYMLEREERDERRAQRQANRKPRSRSRSKPAAKERALSPRESDVSWVGDEREYLRKQWTDHQEPTSSRPLPEPTRPSTPPSLPARPLPDPTSSYVSPPPSARPLPEPTSSVASPPSPARPLPNPAEYKPPPAYNRSPFAANRISRYIGSNAAPPAKPSPNTYTSPENALSSAAESAMESQRRMQSQQKTKAGGWAAKSIVEREMEAERARQREWEEGQKEQKTLKRDANEGSAPGQTWDVNMYGYTGGDNQNRVGTGIGLGGRRQIIGPRPKPGQ